MTTDKLSLKEARKSLGFSVKELSKLAKISQDVIYSIERRNRKYMIHDGVASALAKALGLKIDEIDWPCRLSHLGRPDGTGKSIKLRVNREYTISVTEEITIQSAEPLCNKHLTVVPANGVCDYCS